ncbi:hypothetical protein Bdt_3279 [Bdellovibrio bacteriovorus str. Tiberius]|uniref:Uncharacterized protein n=1 Tax=Bdellovibrio bacteriovorus str. Tiberius TaxID=1069642 RepID=K7ZC76_BDEBC|nr:hypothetical protein Bdt_3279 [Bdellovibrio bacteriovorus str. Tiberius]
MTQQTHIKKIKPLKPKPSSTTKLAGPGGGNGEGCIPVR